MSPNRVIRFSRGCSMRPFKNRGEIYFSKVNKEKSKEQKILFTALAVIVVFTVLFVCVLAVTNDFSAKKFFAPDNLPSVSDVNMPDDELIELPEVEGKRNYAFMLYDNSTMLFTALIQSDMDTKAFKVSIIRGDTQLEGNTLSSLFASAGAENSLNAIEALFGVDFDYYIAVDSKSYQDFYDKLGAVSFPIVNDIKYKEEKSPVSYSLKMKAGEQTIDGKHFVNLIRYYIDAENNFSQANELMLAALAQQLNSGNMADSDNLFRKFSAIADTNISVRDYSLAADRLAVVTNEQSAINVYNAPCEYEDNKISNEGIKKVKGYFVK